MALGSTVFKADLQVTDMDRGYYAAHPLTIAQHPSETDERMMVRLLAFALNATDSLAFGKGISSDDEPDLWQRDLTGEIELWIEIGQPDEQRIRRACGRSRQVIVYTYSGRSAEEWWKKIAAPLAKLKNLRVIDVPHATTQALGALARRNMTLQLMVQDGEIQMMGDDAIVAVELVPLMGATPG